MTGSPQSSHAEHSSRSEISSPLRRERRKTVTFDEILDVQEFDKESSFDADSIQDTEENEPDSVSADADFWMQENASRQLKVVNHGDMQASSDDAADLLSGQWTDEEGPCGVVDLDALYRLADALPRARRAG